MNDIIKREKESILQTYKRLPVVVDYASGCYIYDKEGNKYLDFLAGIAVNALGHSHPAIIEAIQIQASKYLHISNYFYQEPQIELAEQIKEISGLDRVFYSNSGTEATDGAIKLARKWGFENGKTEVIGFSGGFHGRTYGALSIMDKPNYKNGMGPFLESAKVLPFNGENALENGISEKTAAVFLEFIQGEGGISEPNSRFLNALMEMKEKFGFLLVADEIQAGIGRSGKYFAFQHYSIVPDIITSAKGLGGGLPLGAIITKESLANIWEKGNHGTTYGGNALACATGLVVLNELKNGLLDQITRVGEYFHHKLLKIQSKYPETVLEVRGRGLMKGLLLSYDAALLVDKLLEHRVISNAASGTVLRLVPPLIVTEKEIDEFIENLSACLD